MPLLDKLALELNLLTNYPYAVLDSEGREHDCYAHFEDAFEHVIDGPTDGLHIRYEGPIKRAVLGAWRKLMGKRL
jgi:hypothetical protein